MTLHGMWLKIKEGTKKKKKILPMISLYKIVPKIVAGLSCRAGGLRCPEHFHTAREIQRL